MRTRRLPSLKPFLAHGQNILSIQFLIFVKQSKYLLSNGNLQLLDLCSSFCFLLIPSGAIAKILWVIVRVSLLLCDECLDQWTSVIYCAPSFTRIA